MGGMPSMEECAAAKCNKLDVHDGNMNGAFNVSLAEKKRNRRGHRTLSFMQFKNICLQNNKTFCKNTCK